MNWLLILGVGIVAGFIATTIFEHSKEFASRKTKKRLEARIKGFHFHHSLYGITAILFSYLFGNLILLGTGIGIICRHSWSEKNFAFISRD